MYELKLYYVCSLVATVAANNVEFYSLTFVEGLETVALDSGEVNEYIVAAFDGDETIALFAVKPFYCTCHD